MPRITKKTTHDSVEGCIWLVILLICGAFFAVPPAWPILIVLAIVVIFLGDL